MSRKTHPENESDSVADKIESATEAPALKSTSVFKQDVGVLARQHMAIIALVVIAFLAYIPSLRGMYSWDDGLWVTSNATVTERWGLRLIWTSLDANPHYYPLTMTSLWIDHKIWGLGVLDAENLRRPYGFHLTNTALHLISVVLLYMLVRRLKLPGGEFGAWLVAAIYALHPVNVESVAWITERKNVLSQVFYFASMLFALRFFGVTEPDPARMRRDYSWAIWLFFAALLSKTTTCILPVAILILIWWKHGRVSLKNWLAVIPFFVLSIGMGLITAKREIVAGAEGAEWNFTWAQRIIISGRAFWFYLRELVWPNPIMQVYPRWPYDALYKTHNVAPYAPLDWLYPISVVALFVVLFLLRKKISRGPFAAMAYFLAAVGLALGFLNFYTQLYTFVADHYQYLAIPGAIVLLVETLLYVVRRFQPALLEADTYRQGRWIAAGVLLAPLTVITMIEGNRYADDIKLWEHNLAYNRDCFVAWDNLAACRGNRGDPEGARQGYEMSVKVRPNDWRGYEGLANYCMTVGDLEGAKRNQDLAYSHTPASVIEQRAKWYEFRRNLLISLDLKSGPVNPTYAKAQQLEREEKYPEALKEYQQALVEMPQDYLVPYHIGNMYVEMDQYETAEQWYVKALTLNPEHAESYWNLFLVLRQLHHEPQAIKAFNMARQLNPNIVLEHIAKLKELDKAPVPMSTSAPAK